MFKNAEEPEILVNQLSYVINFVPNNLKWLTEQEYIEYHGDLLKTSFLLDIIHNIRSKYNLYDDSECLDGFPLNATLLMENYGNNYRKYLDYLTDWHGTFGPYSVPVLYKTKDHVKGEHAKMFSMSKLYLDEKYFYYKNHNPKILKRKKAQLNSFFTDKQLSAIDLDIRLEMYKDLSKFTVNAFEAKRTLDLMHQEGKITYSKKQKNLQTVESILEGVVEYSADQHGRLHTIFTRLKKEIRLKNLLVNYNQITESTVEFDIKNSQPTMFLSILREHLSEIDIEEFENYKKICRDGEVYDKLVAYFKSGGVKITRKDAKGMIYTYLFGPPISIKNKKKHSIRMAFIKLFGKSIDNWLNKFKLEHEKGYKAFSWLLQNYESKIIFNTIVKEIKMIDSSIPIITIHDSIIVPKSKEELVKSIFDKHIDAIFEKLN